jgi:hypothetical protein
MDDVHSALAKFQVPAGEETEVVDIIESTRDAIVVVPPLQPGPSNP